jgi:hypothetical protein
VDSSPTAADGFLVSIKWVPMLVLRWLGFDRLGMLLLRATFFCYRSEIKYGAVECELV